MFVEGSFYHCMSQSKQRDTESSHKRFFFLIFCFVFIIVLLQCTALWMILLPAALYEPFATEDFSGALFFKGFAVIPTTGLVALFLFGIEELAKQLEEPFSILPLETFCDTIRTSNRDMLEWCIESSSRRMQHNNDSKQPTSSSE